LFAELTRGAFWGCNRCFPYFHSLWSKQSLPTEPLNVLERDVSEPKMKAESQFLLGGEVLIDLVGDATLER
jgi:hypothetical protein